MAGVIGLYKTECLRPGPFVTGRLRGLSEVELATIAWVEWWNHRRLHSSIGHVPPVQYETEHYRHTPATRPAALTT